MVFNKENIILIDSWTLDNLFNPDYWKELIEISDDDTIGSFESPFQSLPEERSTSNPVLQERFRKDHMIEFLWELLPQEHKVSFFDDEYTVFYIWANDIAIDNLIKLHDFLIKREMDKVPSHISGTTVYKNMVESRNKAYSDMKPKAEPKEIILMKFYDKILDEEVISLNTPEYVMVSGTNDKKVNLLRDQLLNDKGYTLSYVMNYESSETIPIYVLFPKA